MYNLETLNLFDGIPPNFCENAHKEKITFTKDNEKTIHNVTNPSITIFTPQTKNIEISLIVCPGGAYKRLAWDAHVTNIANVLCPLGVTVVGLKYRLGKPPQFAWSNPDRWTGLVDAYGLSRQDITSTALIDGKRAVRMVRSLNKNHRVGVVGYSAGANLAMYLATTFDLGDSTSTDIIEHCSCKSDFNVCIGTWHFKETSPVWNVTKDTVPTFFIHAHEDPVAPIELTKNIVLEYQKHNVPYKISFFNVKQHKINIKQSHSVGHLTQQRVQGRLPDTEWPLHLLEWVDVLFSSK